MKRTSLIGFVIIVTTWLSACDTVQPESAGTLVVEAYFDSGKPLPRVKVHQTAVIDALLSDVRIGVTDAVVTLTLNGIRINYIPVADSGGIYRPESSETVFLNALDHFTLTVSSDSRRVSGSGMIPPKINISNVRVNAPDSAIEAVLIDSLNLGLDSLNIAIDARDGYIFPVEVSIDWLPPENVRSDDEFWVETRLNPRQQFSSSLLDFFLLFKQILPEEEFKMRPNGVHHWTGIYAVTVPHKDSTLPVHELKISLLRGDQSFARFATTTNEPNRRAPVGNVLGGIGFIGGVSLDSLRITVKQGPSKNR